MVLQEKVSAGREAFSFYSFLNDGFFPVFKDGLKQTVLRQCPKKCTYTDIPDCSFSLVQLALIVVSSLI